MSIELLEIGDTVEVRVKTMTVDMPVKQNGIEFEVRSTDGSSQLGDCYVTMVGITWCKGKTTKPKGVKVSWTALAEILRTDESLKAALTAAKAT